MRRRTGSIGFLNDYASMPEAIRHKQYEIAEIEAMLDVSGYDPTREHVSGSKGADMLADRLYMLDCRREELAGMIESYMEFQEYADRIIGGLENPAHQTALHMFYMEGKSTAEISKALFCTRKNVYDVLNAAEKAVRKAIAT